MNPLEILLREHELVRKEVLELEEMTYSPSVNTRDFSELFRRLSRFWDMHEEKEENLIKVLSFEGYRVDFEKVYFEHGILSGHRKAILEAIDSGDEEIIKQVIKTTCGELIDVLRAHMMAEDMLFASISWEELDKETLQKILLLQIIPSEELI